MSFFPTDPAKQSAVFTIIMAAILLIIKLIAYIYVSSSSVLAALGDSFADCFLSCLTFYVIYESYKPASETHRYGKGKLEGLSALFQTGLVSGIALFVIMDAVQRFLRPEPMENHMLGIGLLSLSTVLTIIMVTGQKYFLKRTDSLSLQADHAHYAMDVWLNICVIIAILCNILSMPNWIDSAIAILVALFFMHSAFDTGREAINMLTDRQISPDELHRAEELILGHPGVLGVHDLRITRSGKRHIISFDVEMDPSILLWTAHEQGRAIEHSLLDIYPYSQIFIHIDPYGDPDDTRH